jgi:hypothetical protein
MVCIFSKKDSTRLQCSEDLLNTLMLTMVLTNPPLLAILKLKEIVYFNKAMLLEVVTIFFSFRPYIAVDTL